MTDKPIRFFHSSITQYTARQVEKMVTNYGNNILIGGDPGWNNDFLLAMASVDNNNAKKHVYLVGPGMMSWSKIEVIEIMRNARSVGIDTTKKSWHDEWIHHGWEVKLYEWFKKYDKLGFYSAETDNLDSVFNGRVSDYLCFITRFGEWHKSRKLNIRFSLKNLSEDTLQQIIDSTLIDKTIFSNFAMFEKDSGDPKKQIELCKQLGITAITPINGLRDTYHYGTIDDGVGALV